MDGLYLTTNNGDRYIPPFKVDTITEIEPVEDGFMFEVWHNQCSTLIHQPTQERAEQERDTIINIVSSWYKQPRSNNETSPNYNTQISHLRSHMVIHGLERL